MRSVYLGRAFGIPLYIHWSFFLLPLWVLYMSWEESIGQILFAQVGMLSMFGCVLLHELGHALMARAYRIRTRDITLYPIGGVARLESTGHKPSQEVAIALAGPAVNLVLLLMFAPLLVVTYLLAAANGATPTLTRGEMSVWSVAVTYLAVLCAGNLMLMLFNLIPAFPMDGGRVLRALLTEPLGLIPATSVAVSIGMVLGVCMAIAGILFLGMPSLLLVGVFVVLAGQAELQMLRRVAAMQEQERQRRESYPPIEMFVVPMHPTGGSMSTPIDEMPNPGERSGFTGFLWDPHDRVWVRWVNGRKEGVF